MATMLAAGLVNADQYSLLSAQGFGFVEASKFPGARAQFMARRAAKVDAQRNLLETINGVRVTSGTTVKDMTLESDIIGTRVKGLLQGAFEMQSNVVKEDGNWVADVTMAVCMSRAADQCTDKPTLTAVLQPSLEGAPMSSRYSPEASTSSDSVQGGQVSEDSLSTGLIIDASQVSFSPMLDVRIQTRQGKELYGPGHVVKGTNWLNWASSVQGANSMKAVIGNHPLEVNVTGLGEQSQLIVSDQDAVMIFGRNLASGDFLAEGRVVFVVAGS